jgi:hypothetical protein
VIRTTYRAGQLFAFVISSVLWAACGVVESISEDARPADAGADALTGEPDGPISGRDLRADVSSPAVDQAPPSSDRPVELDVNPSPDAARDAAAADMAVVVDTAPIKLDAAVGPDLPPALKEFSDDFDRTPSPNVGNNWTEKTPAAWDIFNNSLRRLDTSQSYEDNVCYRPAAEDLLNVEVSVEIKLSSIPPGRPILFVRGQRNTIATPATLDAYFLYLSLAANPRAILVRQRTGSPASTNLPDDFALPNLNTTDTFRMRLRVQGTNPVVLTAWVERLQGIQWVGVGTATVNDSDPERITGAGTMGVSGNEPNPAYVFDNFHAIEIRP